MTEQEATEQVAAAIGQWLGGMSLILAAALAVSAVIRLVLGGWVVARKIGK